jgi:hypothetical protein
MNTINEKKIQNNIFVCKFLVVIEFSEYEASRPRSGKTRQPNLSNPVLGTKKFGFPGFPFRAESVQVPPHQK